MNCYEKGTLDGSVYYFFSPSEMFREYYFYMLLCGHFYCNSDYKIVREGNTSPLFIYILSGELHVRLQNRQYTAGEHEIILIDCSKPHSYYCTASCEFLFFHFDGANAQNLTEHLISQNESAVFRLTNHKEILKPLDKLLKSLENNDYPSDIDLSCIAYSILCRMQSFNDVTTTASSPMSEVIAEVINYMKKNIQEPLPLDVLADHVNISVSYLSHQFRAETGCSPIEYLARLKINYAKTILRSTNRTVSDIALSLGYSSSASFINAFTSRVGISPKQFRSSPIL